jgi:hypothetical protein
MRVKLFIKDKSSFSTWQQHTGQFEEEINHWLATNPGVRIVDIKQSSNGGSFHNTKVVISIWHEPGGAADSVAPLAGIAAPSNETRPSR